ncbi:MAG TPA: SIS domain-containing protein [Mycobacteriales bacterium]|nr:SIS domain-containing protein [Mycobacteriales bacterium]
MVSTMQETMARQPEDLRRLGQDTARVDEFAATLTGLRRVLVVGTGTSWHTAHQGAWFLQRAGVDARAMQSADFATDGPDLGQEDGVIGLTHTGAKRYTGEALDRARASGAVTLTVSAIGVTGADLETVERETSSAYTASHLGALYRMAQLAVALGADLGDLDAVADTVSTALAEGHPEIDAPERLVEFIGGGINQWTAAEAALKCRETAYVATEGHALEQFLHGPSVALHSSDTLVCFDGGGPWTTRLTEISDAARQSGVTVKVLSAQGLGEPLSVFPLTVAAQRIALGLAEALGTNPDSFGRDVPGREAWKQVPL